MSTNDFVCPICGNTDIHSIGYLNGKPYCRRCVSFRGELADPREFSPHPVALKLDYPLSKNQQRLSDQALDNFKKGIDTLLYAVCGSGKTEISYGVIGFAMAKGMHVGFALPRKDVVIELHQRLVSAFPSSKIIAVYGGNHDELVGDCVVLTTHQLFRYPNYFDLLVMDEIDAFPFKGSDILFSLYKRSLRGHCLMMSATPSKSIVKEFTGEGKQMFTLHTRFHQKDIPVPRICRRFVPWLYLSLILWIRRFGKEKKPCFVFVPTVSYSESVYRLLKPFCPNGNYASSKRKGRDKIISSFCKKKLSYIVTTAVLERGVTVANAQVIIVHADHSIYDTAALIQIAGRAGRKAYAPTGKVIFLSETITESMEEAQREIRYCNSFL